MEKSYIIVIIIIIMQSTTTTNNINATKKDKYRTKEMTRIERKGRRTVNYRTKT